MFKQRKVQRCQCATVTAVLIIVAVIFCQPLFAVSSFFELIINGELDAVRRQITRDPVLATMADELGRSPLHLAVIHGHLAIVNVLINAGADVNGVDRLKNYTPLHYAAFYSFPKIMQFLLSRRADVYVSDRDGNLPLHLAAANGCPATVEILLEWNSSPDCMNKNWQTPLHLAARASDNRKEFHAASKNDDNYLEVTRLLLLGEATAGIHDIWRNLPETIAWQKDGHSTFPGRFSKLLRDFGRSR